MFCVGTLIAVVPYCAPRHLAFPCHAVFLACLFCTNLVDYFNSDNTQKNYKIIKAAGYSDPYLIFCAFFSQVIIGVMVVFDLMSLPDYTEELWIPTKEHFSLEVFLKVGIIIAGTDWFFCLFHKILHEHFPKIHLLHHCCVYTSLTTNMFFEPLDVLMEFTAPGIFLKMASLVILKDSWVAVLAQALMGAYYALTHDEFLNLQHAKHHRGCATGYFIYRNYFYADSKKEQVRKIIPGFLKSTGKKES